METVLKEVVSEQQEEAKEKLVVKELEAFDLALLQGCGDHWNPK